MEQDREDREEGWLREDSKGDLCKKSSFCR